MKALKVLTAIILAYLFNGFVCESGADAAFIINSPCFLSTNTCTVNNNSLLHGKVIVIPEGECSSVDTLLSISIYCWEDARFEGDTINYLKISNLIGDRANPPWTGDSSEMSAPGKIFVADTIKIYFVDTVSQEERFVLQLVGKYSYTIENDSTTAYAIINRLNYLSNGKPQEMNKVINVAIKPNPASNSLNLKYLVLAPTKISVILYDSNGELITKLVDNEEISVGEHQLEYDTQGLSPGTYFLVVMQDGKTKISRKFIIVR